MKGYGICLLLSLLLIFSLWGSEEEILKVRRDIILLNLVNGLHLEENQMEQLLTLVKRWKEVKEDFQNKMERLSQEKLEPFETLREELIKQDVAISSLNPSFFQANREFIHLKKEFEEKREEIIQQVESLLNENQKEILKEFVPCIIPPKDINSQRAGQETSLQSGTRLLDRIRNMPERLYERKKEEIVERILQNILKRKKHIQISEEEWRERIEEVLEEARNLNEVEYELLKEELAQKLHPAPKLSKDKPEILKFKISHFLLDPRMEVILEEKLGYLQ